MMYKLTLSTLLVLLGLVSSTLAQQLMQDVIYLKDGTIIRGQIIEQVPNVSIKIQTREGNVFVYKMEDILKITKEPFWGMGKMSGMGQKSPGVAFALSFLVPGVGQYYNGEITKGITQEVIFIGGLVLYIVGVNEYDDTLQSIGVITYLGSWVWSMIDAPLSARRINRERSLQNFGHLIEFHGDKYALGLDVGPKKRRMNAKLTLHF